MSQEAVQQKNKTKEPKLPYKPSFFHMAVFLPLMLMVLIGMIWGLGDWTAFRQDPVRGVFSYFQNPFRVLYLVFLLVEGSAAYFSSPLFRRPKDELVREWVHWQNHYWEIVLAFSVYSDSRGLWLDGGTDTVRWAGAILLCLALGVEIASRLTRRRIDQQDPEADYPQEGIFDRIRYPEYLELILQSIGIALLFNSWVGAFAAFIVICLIVARVLAQDRVMLQKYELAWGDYQSRSKRLIPGMW